MEVTKLLGILLASIVVIDGRVWDVIEAADKQINHNSTGEVKKDNIIDGDIMLSDYDVKMLQGEIQGDAVINSRSKWPVTTIPYAFASSLNTKARSAVNASIREYAQKTCIRFRKKTSGDKDYIRIFPGRGCYSYVGRVGGKQKISLGRGCEYRLTVVHEMMHALGFWHEQSRPGRDDYIKIHFENIYKGKEGIFAKHRSLNFGHSYDYDSVMHYSNKAFSKNGKATITSKKGNPNRNFGQPWNGSLSVIDAAQINAFYCGGKPVTTKKPVITSKPGCGTSGSCVDKYRFCPIIARQGFCSDCFVKVNCSKSCAGPDKNWQCPHWAKRGYCSGRYQRYMSQNCKSSCGLTTCNGK